MSISSLSALVLLTLLLTSHSAFAANGTHPSTPSSDERTLIQLNASERSAVLAEMRGFLHSTQQIVSAVAVSDMQLAADSARKSGRSAAEQMPSTLRSKLPPAFKKLGSDTHRRFDALALDAEQLGDETHTLSQLGELLGNCVACHAIFRIGAE